MTKPEFIICLTFLQNYFHTDLKPDIEDAYWNRFKEFSKEQFEKMSAKVQDTYRPSLQNPFPLFRDFLESIGLSGENRAQAAVTAVKNAVERWGAWYSVDFGDPALHAVINRCGGWPEVCSWGNAGKWPYNEKKFLDAYEAAVACGESAGPVEGNFEIGNRAKNMDGWNETQKLTYQNAIAPKKMAWIGADFEHRLGNKKTEQKRIASEPATVAEILK